MKEKEIDIRYLNRDFDSIKEALKNLAQVYYPDTYNDFSEESPGTMFIDMASYVGDVLSFYTDVQFKENLIQYAEERENVVDLANSLGYTTQPTRPAIVELDVYIVVPAVENNNGDTVPDESIIPVIEEGMRVSSDSNPDIQFRTTSELDFTEDSESSPREVRIFELNPNTGDPELYLLKKQVQAISGVVKTREFTFEDPERYVEITLPENNVIDIISVTDEDDRRWSQVPYLAQDVVFEEFKNTRELDPEFSEFEDVDFMLNLKRVPRRFTRRTLSDNKTVLQFGGGVSRNPDERLIPNPKNIGNPVIPAIDKLDLPLDPTNFLDTTTYGQVPFDTTLTVEYTIGGGEQANVPVNDLTNIVSVNFAVDDLVNLSNIDRENIQAIEDSIAVRNSVPATGGAGGESNEEIRQNAMAFFAAQNRAVTKEDYAIRALSMPARYGSVAKVVVTRDEIILRSEVSDNPLGLNLYVLSYDEDKKLQAPNEAVKQNLKTYLKRYRMLTDGVNIKNGFVINIGIDFEIIVFNTFNKRQVLLKCIEKLKEIFDTDNQQFSQPILLGQVEVELASIEGVQNVAKLEFKNLWREEEGYSGNIYDIQSATKDGIIYPSLDPSIFEIRFPTKDIRGRAQ